MKNLGDQWIEIIDGEEHMVKLVEAERGNECPLCIFHSIKKGGCQSKYYCPGRKKTIKDLGILNKDGCLPNGWGEYPHVEGVRDTKTWVVWYRCVTRMGVYCTTDSYKTKEEAIDAWNRRE
jgi:hypothetical protein